MRKMTDLLYDTLGADDCYALQDLAFKYHCPTTFEFSVDIIGLSYALFWLGVIAGSASAKLELPDYELCGKAQAVISKELFKISQGK